MGRLKLNTLCAFRPSSLSHFLAVDLFIICARLCSVAYLAGHWPAFVEAFFSFQASENGTVRFGFDVILTWLP